MPLLQASPLSSLRRPNQRFQSLHITSPGPFHPSLPPRATTPRGPSSRAVVRVLRPEDVTFATLAAEGGAFVTDPIALQAFQKVIATQLPQASLAPSLPPSLCLPVRAPAPRLPVVCNSAHGMWGIGGGEVRGVGVGSARVWSVTYADRCTWPGGYMRVWLVDAQAAAALRFLLVAELLPRRTALHSVTALALCLSTRSDIAH